KITERGQELVEFGITITLFMTIALGVITFGHAFMVANMVTHAARDGARLASIWSGRTGPCGLIDSTGVQPLKDSVTNAIHTVVTGTFTVTVTQTPTQTADVPCAAQTRPPSMDCYV